MARIVVVEDNVHILGLIQNVFQLYGHEVFVSDKGDCLKLVTQVKPQFVLADNWLPDIKGEELCRTIKSESDTAHIKVYLVSASCDLPAIAHRCNADGFLRKPFDIKDLYDIVNDQIH